jgi:hypothetical protein
MKKTGKILFWIIIALLLVEMVAGWSRILRIMTGICAIALIGTIIYRLINRK